MLMQKNTKKPIEKVEAEKIESNPKSKMLQGLKYSISMDSTARSIPIIEQPKQSEQPGQEIADPKKKVNKTKLLRLLDEIKQHPEVLKLLHKTKHHKEKFVNYKSANLIHDFQIILASSLKAIDSAVSFIMYKSTKNDPTRNEVVQQARSPILFGIWVSIVTFVIGGLWSALAPLDSSAPAQGSVVVDTDKKIIQHKEGGIIDAIYVKDGDHVKQGQELIRLSAIELQASISSAEAQHESLSKQLELLREQVAVNQELLDKGFAQKSKVVELQLREHETLSNLNQVEAKTIAAKDALNRLVITSPIDGIVNQLAVHTIGGVVRSGEALLSIIPQDDNLVIDAYVDPKDIDSVHVGLKAKVRITAFKGRSTAPLDGVVVQVSPDVVDRGNNMPPAYKVRVEVDKAQLTKISRLRNYELYPGMQAEINIVTGERTFLQYLMDPVTSTFWHAFNEK
jgi:HlyD family secretion protein